MVFGRIGDITNDDYKNPAYFALEVNMLCKKFR